jgi:hypothetical protein
VTRRPEMNSGLICMTLGWPGAPASLQIDAA